MHLIEWNTERAAKLWAEGLSTGCIAEQIGVTKSMVCGYAGRNRDQFPLRGSPVKRSGATKRPYKDRQVKPKTDRVRSDGAIELLRAQIASVPRPRVVAPAIKPPPPIFVNTNRTCLFPMWSDTERPTHVYCDAPTAGTYCAEHRAICFSTVIRWGMAA